MAHILDGIAEVKLCPASNICETQNRSGLGRYQIFPQCTTVRVGVSYGCNSEMKSYLTKPITTELVLTPG